MRGCRLGTTASTAATTFSKFTSEREEKRKWDVLSSWRNCILCDVVVVKVAVCRTEQTLWRHRKKVAANAVQVQTCPLITWNNREKSQAKSEDLMMTITIIILRRQWHWMEWTDKQTKKPSEKRETARIDDYVKKEPEHKINISNKKKNVSARLVQFTFSANKLTLEWKGQKRSWKLKKSKCTDTREKKRRD